MLKPSSVPSAYYTMNLVYCVKISKRAAVHMNSLHSTQYTLNMISPPLYEPRRWFGAVPNHHRKENDATTAFSKTIHRSLNSNLYSCFLRRAFGATVSSSSSSFCFFSINPTVEILLLLFGLLGLPEPIYFLLYPVYVQLIAGFNSAP